LGSISIVGRLRLEVRVRVRHQDGGGRR
jgi:hypothetical protein